MCVSGCEHIEVGDYETRRREQEVLRTGKGSHVTGEWK